MLFDLFTSFAHYYAYPLLVLLALFGFAFYKHKKIFIVALFLSALTAQTIKPMYFEPRPCAGNSTCPESYGFPSTHSAVAGAFAIASIGSPASFFAIPFSMALAYSRMYSNVHSFEQVAAGYSLGLLVYALIFLFLHKHSAHKIVVKHKLLE